MPREVWFQLVDEEGKSLTKAFSVSVAVDVASAFLRAVKKEYSDSHLERIAASDLTVFPNRTAYNAKRALIDDSPIRLLGGSKQDALIVEVPQPRRGGQLRKSNAINEILLREFRALSNRLSQESMRQVHMVAAIDALIHKESTSISCNVLGQTELHRLETAGLVINVAPTEKLQAFWSAEDQLQANAIPTEAAFLAFMTTFFNDVVRELGLVFVNSRKYRWLPQSSCVAANTDLKPDGFATHRGMYRVKDSRMEHAEGFRFGVPEKGLFDCVILFECTTGCPPKPT